MGVDVKFLENEVLGLKKNLEMTLANYHKISGAIEMAEALIKNQLDTNANLALPESSGEQMNPVHADEPQVIAQEEHP